MLAELIARPFGAAARARGSKAFHPRGVVHDATVTVDGTAGAPAPWLRQSASYDAIVRFSRGIGLPHPLPDVLGIAVRILGAHGEGRDQDLLLVTSGNGPVIHHLLLPARSYTGLPYSSLAPYSTEHGHVLLGARAESAGRFELGWAPLGGRLQPFGSLAVGARRDDADNALRFSVMNSGGGLEPSTWVNRIRPAAYASSQEGWAGAPAEALTEGPALTRATGRAAATPAAPRR